MYTNIPSLFPTIPIVPASKISTIPTIPTKVHLYNMLSGQEVEVLNPFDNMHGSMTFNQYGINIQISGKRCDINKAVSILRQNLQGTDTDDKRKMFSHLIDYPAQTAYPKVNFYDKFTGKYLTSQPLYSNDGVITTSNFCECGINVNISGKRTDVNRALLALRNCKNEFNTHTQATSLSESSQKQTILEPTGEWRYIVSPTNTLKSLLTHPLLAKPFSGSGVIIIEINPKPTVILVNTTREKAEDMGGEIDSKSIGASDNTLKLNAKKELAEESENLFTVEKIDLDGQTYVDIQDPINDAIYRCYIVTVTGTSNNLHEQYMNNRNILAKFGAEFRESTNIRQFYVDSINTSLISYSNGDLYCVDTSGAMRIIRDRTASCLKNLLNNKEVYDNLLKKVVNVKPVQKSSGIITYEM